MRLPLNALRTNSCIYSALNKASFLRLHNGCICLIRSGAEKTLLVGGQKILWGEYSVRIIREQ